MVHQNSSGFFEELEEPDGSPPVASLKRFEALESVWNN